MITSIKIGEFNYQITEVEKPGQPDETRELHAYVLYSQCQIQLRQDANPDMKAVALLHEILHAIIRQTGLEFEGDDYTEEKFVIAISHGLLALLRHNPELLNYITGGQNGLLSS